MIRRSTAVAAAAFAFALVPTMPAAGTDAYRNPTPGAEIALQIPGMHKAVVRPNVVYARSGGRALRLDVYRPAGSTRRARFPGVLLVHGSTTDPSPKDWGIYVGWGQLLAAHGLAGIPFNHRGSTSDIGAALRAVRRRPRARRRRKAPLRGELLWWRGRRSHGCRARQRRELRARLLWSPRPTPLEPDSTPTFVAKGGLDSSFINDAIDAYVARGKAIGADVRLVVHPRAGHAFDLARATREPARYFARPLPSPAPSSVASDRKEADVLAISLAPPAGPTRVDG